METVRPSDTAPDVQRGERRAALVICIIFFVFSVTAAIFGKSLGPNTASVLPLVAVVWSFCDLLTALLLLVEF